MKEKDDRMNVQKTQTRGEDDDDGDYRDTHAKDTHKSMQREQTKDGDGKQKGKQGQKKKKLEPSLKWKALGMEEYKEGWMFYLSCFILYLLNVVF